MKLRTLFSVGGALLLLNISCALALINPRVQPSHLYQGYQHVLSARVDEINSDKLAITLNVEQVIKGEFEPKAITLEATEEAGLESVLSVARGQRVVAFVSRAGRRGQDQVLYYVGGGRWYVASIEDMKQPGRWTLRANADAGKAAGSEDIMFGVFNGSVEQFHRLVRDEAQGRAYFPASPFTRFEARTLTKLGKAVRGVGLHDFDGDGRLDVIATSDAGVRILLQQDDGSFTDATEQFGLAEVRARSVSAADWDNDGHVDLLLDGVIYRRGEEAFKKTEHFIAPAEDVLSAAFVELDGDGYPDVVVSRRGGGLTAFGNPFGTQAAGGAKLDTAQWPDISRQLGLRQDAALPDGAGYFEPLDWNADGRTDLLYLTGPGLILLRQDEGFKAIPISHDDMVEWGAAAAGPIVDAEVTSAFLTQPDGKMLISSQQQPFADVTRYGNEIQDDAPGLLMPIAEDLNADGTLDLYTAAQHRGVTSLFLMNRGYGSFMLSEKYAGGRVIPPSVYKPPAWGLAAGDVNGDGANDLLVGGLDGVVHLLINRTLENRPTRVKESTIQEKRKQIQARLLTVALSGRGVVGAELRLLDGDGRLVAERRIGGNVGVGCAQPHQFVLVAREAGPHTLQIRFADGTRAVSKIDLSAARPRHQRVEMHNDPQAIRQ